MRVKDSIRGPLWSFYNEGCGWKSTRPESAGIDMSEVRHGPYCLQNIVPPFFVAPLGGKHCLSERRKRRGS